MAVLIEGFDTAHAIQMFGGDEAIYLDVLDAFCEDTEKWYKIISRYPAETDLKSLTTSVHGFKSAAREVGAMAAGDFAYTVEMAAKSNDIAFVDANLANLLEVMSGHLSRCRIALGKSEDVKNAENVKAQR